MDFVLSEEGQKLVLSQGYLPARNGMPSPEGFPDRKEIKLLPFDASKALENTENDKAGFSKLFE